MMAHIIWVISYESYGGKNVSDTLHVPGTSAQEPFSVYARLKRLHHQMRTCETAPQTTCLSGHWLAVQMYGNSF
jgi:hypothetical protein